MEYFSISEEKLLRLGALFTAREIWGQPSVWSKTSAKFFSEKKEITMFRDEMIKKSKKIILTGAGTSAYIGYSLEGTFQRHTGITTVSIPTTHLVTHPRDYLDPELPTLVVSFARSGNSPESVAAVRLIDRICTKVAHLVITCDANGELARYQSKNDKFTFILPPESNDLSLAMTGSYTSMLLSGLLFARLPQTGELDKQVELLVAYGNRIIRDGKILKEIASLPFQRAVFLGSGPMFGTSTESSLKLQELTDGNIICKNDTYLGFRHGPRAVIDENTLVVFLFSCKDSVQRYERDLVRSMQKGKKAFRLIGVSEKPVEGVALDTALCFSQSGTGIDEDFLSICSVLPAQMLGFFKSIGLGLKPDSPSVSGAISRVVEGVVIYDTDVA
ncbi:MAG: SIS domain-containing protein [Bacteroidota bacterium]